MRVTIYLTSLITVLLSVLFVFYVKSVSVCSRKDAKKEVYHKVIHCSSDIRTKKNARMAGRLQADLIVVVDRSVSMEEKSQRCL